MSAKSEEAQNAPQTCNVFLLAASFDGCGCAIGCVPYGPWRRSGSRIRQRQRPAASLRTFEYAGARGASAPLRCRARCRHSRLSAWLRRGPRLLLLSSSAPGQTEGNPRRDNPVVLLLLPSNLHIGRTRQGSIHSPCPEVSPRHV